VGIEVPNGKASMVSLRGAIDSDDYHRAKGELKVALGRGTSGAAVAVDIIGQPHLLIAGATGSGKSVCINSIITNLLMMHDPDNLKLLMIDPKMVELTAYNGIPHLIAPVITDFEQVAGALAWVTREMERRYKAFAATGARSITTYNRKMDRKEQLPYLVVIIDELADLMMLAADEVEKYICRIAQMARATGIHMIIATQRPSTDVVTGLIKANFPSRIAFAVASQIDSRVILDSPGAERLLGKGDMLYMASDSPKLARIQGCFVSDPEIHNVVDYWKRARLAVEPEPDLDLEAENEAAAEAKLPWDDLVKEANQDDLLKEAIQLVVETGRASTTFLQRRLGIGYPRASRLMDQLEEEGVVGPAAGANPREVHWHEDNLEA
jgi:S-DNA-T family DNA segregation ATPase FtsK/SpoIIIE